MRNGWAPSSSGTANLPTLGSCLSQRLQAVWEGHTTLSGTGSKLGKRET